ncbi:MAG: hypothetical protein J0I33_00110 [Microbacterium ginsengisoli]|uniref:hypothetical protein n=1 Tax=Microbacterium TaxID=33882 RepID=UPI0006F49544|nr:MULTISPECIES: hypothetical protein [unclassified Microbacterium]KQR91290.1 hypothetical protein ASF93_08055 [Microbacterium sp. Leaf347]KQS01278.1 hypothetical protein ASG00_10885 [Microbacterium sp. Leaf351]MBN9197036.1 hypothetical protein [Microbacterium ginsengisoli]OJU76994.1 MAG: hypothetical protein BGO15_05680 [Microbacterium sp. 71-23]
MSGIHAGTGVLLARDGLEAAIRAALADEAEVDIYAGWTWPIVHDDSVQLTAASGAADPKTVSARRSYDETITLGISITVWRAGHSEDDGSAAEAYQRAFALLNKITAYVVEGDHTELGGAVMWCLPGAVDSDGTEYNSGFQVEVAAEFICAHRVRGQ